MTEKYLIFNHSVPTVPISIMEGYNSKWLELERDEAIKFVNEKNKEREGFYYLSFSEYLNIINELQKSGFFDKMDIEKENVLNESQDYKKLRGIVDADMEKLDNNINGFSLPIAVANNEDYINKLQEILTKFVLAIDKPSFQSEDCLIDDVKSICDIVIQSLYLAISGKADDAETKLANLLQQYMTHEFGVSELDKSYAFRGLAPFKELHSNNAKEGKYESMMNDNLTFFRGRTVRKGESGGVYEIKDICSLPYSKRHKSNDLRFSSKGEICLYLGTTTFICSKECRWDKDLQDLYVSAFKFKDKGKKLKILNLVVSEPLINGIYQKSSDEKVYRRDLQCALIKIMPLVIATSFTVKATDKDRKEDVKYEYLLSQLLIKALRNTDIDGVAYLSRQGENDLQYPHGVNLAIPMHDISEEKEYSDLYECLEITQPALVDEDILNKEFTRDKISYVNMYYPEYIDSDKLFPYTLSKVYYEGENIFYGKTIFSKLDNYLVNQEYTQLKI